MSYGAVDANQAGIVEAYRQAGATVAITSDVGDGFVDIVVGHQGVNLLVEIKDGSKPASQRKLTPAQEIFHRDWNGQIAVVKNIKEALALVGIDYE